MAPVGLPWTTLAAGVPAGPARELPSPRRILAQLAIAAVVVFGLVLAGASVAANRLAEREAVNDAAHTANLLALAVVQPALTDALVAGDPASLAAFDKMVRASVLTNGIVRVKLWRTDGTVVYADESRLVGQVFPLDPDQLDAVAQQVTKAEVSDLERTENTFERGGGKLLEVYRPVWTPSGQTLLFEVYGDYAPVAERSGDLWRGLGGLLASSLMLLVVLMTTVLWRVLDRLADAHEQREQLLRRAVDASDEERRRIAANLHDGPVQDLVASSLVVSGAAETTAASGNHQLAADLHEAAATVRATIAGLRSLLVDLYPDRLSDAGLGAALDDLARPLRSRGVTVDLHTDTAVVASLDEEATRLVYRVVRECLRNVAKHAAAAHVTVTVRADDASADHAEPELARAAGARHTEVIVEDDGMGFVVADRPARTGHFGLRVLTDLAEDAGALLQVASAPGRGTRWRLVLNSAPGGMP